MAVKVLLGLAIGAAISVPTPTKSPPTVSCADAAMFATPPRPAPTDRLVLGRVALPRADAALYLAPAEAPGALRFAKRGILVRAGTTVTLEVRRPYGLVFGRVGRRGDVRIVRIRACPTGGWTAFAGGYLVRRPACVTVIARAAGHSALARFGVGRRCR